MDKLENFEVVQVVEDEGRDGPQWKLTGLVPWSQYDVDFWIDQKRYPEKPSKGIHACSFTRGAIKVPRNKSPHDGTLDWMYKWTILELDTKQTASEAGPQPTSPPARLQHEAIDLTAGDRKESPARSTPLLTGQADHPRKTESFERGRAIDLAVQLLIAGKITNDDLFEQADRLYRFQSDPESLWGDDADDPVLEVVEETVFEI